LGLRSSFQKVVSMGMPRLRHVFAILSVTSAPLVAGCAAKPAAPADAPAPAEPTQARSYGQQAGYAPPGQYPQTPGGAVYPGFEDVPASDLPGLQAQLDRAELALAAALDRSRVTADAAVASPKAPAPAASAAPPAPSAAPVTQADPCLVACAALASMKRSADHVCGMTGEKDAVCGGARERVQRAEQRVTQACPACAAR
jgi:hypothetical protein